MVQFHDNINELFLVGLFTLVKFDDALLQHVKERIDTMIVGLLLESSCKPWVNWHYINNYSPFRIRTFIITLKDKLIYDHFFCVWVEIDRNIGHKFSIVSIIDFDLIDSFSTLLFHRIVRIFLFFKGPIVIQLKDFNILIIVTLIIVQRVFCHQKFLQICNLMRAQFLYLITRKLWNANIGVLM